MEQKIDFTLPKKEEKKSGVQGLVVVLLVATVGLSAASLYVAVKGRPAAEASGTNVSFEQAQDLAGKLASRGLYDRAAVVLKEAVARTRLGGADQAKIYFRMAGYLADAGKYDEAVEYYYRSEMFGKVADEQQMKAKLQDCYEKMGKFAAMEREIAARTSMDGEQRKDAVIVAEIGPEKITSERLDEMIEQQIDVQMGRYTAFMSPEQIKERKKEMVKQYTEPAVKQKFLEGWLGQEVLYRQAREIGMAEKPEVKKAVDSVVRGLAAEYVINDEVAKKVSITETDAKNYYEAHKAEFAEPASAQISHILAEDEAKAKEVIEKAKGGGDFSALAKEYSKDDTTKDKGGKMEGEVVKGEYVPGIGQNKELNEKIFAAKEGELVGEAVKTDKGWEVVKVEKLTPQRQRGFDEVKEQVYQQLRGEKTKDVQQAYVKSLMDKFNVVVHTSAFGGKEQEKSK